MENASKALLIAAAVLIVIAVVLCLVCSKTITCTNSKESGGVKVTATLKVHYWFNKISKITTITEIDLSKLNEAQREKYFNDYKNNDIGADVKMNDDSIIITSVNKPTDKDKEKGADKVSPEDFTKDYESIGFTCK